jgi:arabinose-5-phosphate isomerase
MTEALREMSAKGLGFVTVVESGRVTGIFTDGDLRRLIERGESDLRSVEVCTVMHADPRTILASALAAEAARLMEQHRVTSVLVADDEGRLVGALNTNDLMRARVI